jgi:hypothetical protein
VGFQAVKGSHESHRLEIRQLRQLYLADSFVIGQIDEHSALRQRQAERTGSLLESLHVQPVRVLEKETKSAQWVHN